MERRGTEALATGANGRCKRRQGTGSLGREERGAAAACEFSRAVAAVNRRGGEASQGGGVHVLMYRTSNGSWPKEEDEERGKLDISRGPNLVEGK
jgi:hypothetical protein